MTRAGAKKRKQSGTYVVPEPTVDDAPPWSRLIASPEGYGEGISATPRVESVKEGLNEIWVHGGGLAQAAAQVEENIQREIREERDGVREQRAVFQCIQERDGSLTCISALPHGMSGLHGRSMADLYYNFAVMMLKRKVFREWPRCLKAARESTFVVTVV